MLITKEVKKKTGVIEVLLGMATDLNKELAINLNLCSKEIEEAGVNDFFISVLTETDLDIKEILKDVDELLMSNKNDDQAEYSPVTLDSALKYQPDSNIVLISVAGQYAAEEARKALEQGLHVMLFSDNVSLDEERELKQLASEKGLLMMGPDCGTAIINHVPLAFGNVVRKGNIGIIGASGTGTQEVSVLIHKLGEGVSQVLGTGGRDLRKEIGGIMMLQGLKSLLMDPQTKVIVLISKEPDGEVADRILKLVSTSHKPVVINFIGGNKEEIEKYGAYRAITLEDAAYKAVSLLRGIQLKDFEDFSFDSSIIHKIVKKEVAGFHPSQKYIRGFFTGGTLADEAMKLIADFSLPLSDNTSNTKNICIDLGDDQFTLGRPHPMIDPAIRAEWLLKSASDDEVALVLLDFVLGYGSHKDPVGEMIPAIKESKKLMKERGRSLSVVASICGTELDPQNLIESSRRLEDIGVILMPSNAQAARLSALILKGIENHGGVADE